MNAELILTNLLSAPILFFFAGMLGVLLGSDLSIPKPVVKAFSLYLLFAIGLKGGVSVSSGELGFSGFTILVASLAAATVVPFISFFLLRKLVDVPNAAALAAAYGSVSAVTFITASQFLDTQGVSHDGVMVAALALMESPAIIVGIVLARKYGGGSSRLSWRKIFHEACTNGAVFLLLISLIIGALGGEQNWRTLSPLASDLFPGILCLFLLDMGRSAATRIQDLFRAGPVLLLSGVLLPVCFGMIGLIFSWLQDFSIGNALLFAILCGSASYIAVPAAVRLSIPKANPSIYIPMALAVTFPFNIIFGIPMYMSVIQWLWGV